MEKKIIGYMLTWTTYGTWLQGDKRGYVKNGIILSVNQKLQTANRNNQKHPSVKLNPNLILIVKNALEKEAERICQGTKRHSPGWLKCSTWIRFPRQAWRTWATCAGLGNPALVKPPSVTVQSSFPRRLQHF